MLQSLRWRVIGGSVVLAAIAAVLSYGYLLPQPEPLPIVAKETAVPYATISTIGYSVQGRPIEAYTFGSGSSTILFVGGIHGGYEWNSVLLAYEAIDYLKKYPDIIPSSLRVTIVPNANPDGVFTIIKKEGRFGLSDVPEGTHEEGRFNANDVDLNRNFDCKWKRESTWRSQTVSAGTEPFSEPEARALRSLVQSRKPDGVIFWHSQANAVYASECEEGILPGTRTLMNTYAKAANYPTVDTFDAYPVTGDAEGWLASIGIPAISVELSSHESIEWERNLAGLLAVLKDISR